MISTRGLNLQRSDFGLGQVQALWSCATRPPLVTIDRIRSATHVVWRNL